MESELVLHVWPGRWDLPTFTPECLAAVLYAQLAIPGKFVLEECTNPDLSPNGQLPYLTHGLACVASFPSIVKYIAGLHKPSENAVDGEPEEKSGEHEYELIDLSASLTPVERAQQMAWMAFVTANLGDLVACSFYTLRHNYYECTRLALAELFHVPQRYYLPDRLRESYKPRLEAAGLWSVHAEEEEEEKRKKKSVASDCAITETFGKEKVLDKARMTLSILSNLLGEQSFFFHHRPSTLDTLVAAHVLLLTFPPLPNDLLRVLVADAYPALHAHARRMHAHLLSTTSSTQAPSPSPSVSLASSASDLAETQARPIQASVPLRVRAAPPASFSQLVSSLTLPFPRSFGNAKRDQRLKVKSKEDEEFDRMRWAWYGLSLLGVAGWAWAVGLGVVIVKPREREDE